MAKKRKNGQGTVRLRNDGRWEGRHIVGYDENGKAKQKSVLAKTKAECIEKLKKLQEEYTEVAPFKVKPDMRFGDWVNYWYENHCKPSIRPTTQKGYEEWIYVHAIPGLGHIPLNKLTGDGGAFGAKLLSCDSNGAGQGGQGRLDQEKSNPRR